MAGSGIFSSARPVSPTRVTSGVSGLPGEVGDLRRDVRAALAPLAAVTVEEWDNGVAATTTTLMAATASQLATRRIVPAAAPAVGFLTQATLTNMRRNPRQLQFTTAGGTPAHQPATATVVGEDERGKPQTEVVALKSTAGTYLSTKFFTNISYIDLSAGGGAGATLAIGVGTRLGLSRTIIRRAGSVAVLSERALGSVVTTGTYRTAADGTAATVVGSVDLTGVGVPAGLDGLTLIMSVNGAAPVTVLFATPVTAADVVTQVNAAFAPATVAALGGVGSAYLALTSPTTGPASSLNITGGTALAGVGLVAELLKGTAHGTYGSYEPSDALNGSRSYALYYEFQPTE